MTSKLRLCIDFTDLNNAYPKDPLPLPHIDQIVNSTVGCESLCFLDAFFGYHQIMMAVEDQENTAFITPKGCYSTPGCLSASGTLAPPSSARCRHALGLS